MTRLNSPSRAMLLAIITTAVTAPVARAQIYTRTRGDGVIEATNVPDASGFQLTYPGKGTLIHSRGFSRNYRGQFDSHILAASSAYNVSTDLIKAVIQVESEFDHLAVSSKGAQGLMQLMPFTARRFGVSDSFDPRQNIFGGVRFLRFLLDLFKGDISLTLAGYNAGENAVLRHKGIPPYQETRGYVRKIRQLLGGGESPVIAFAPSRNFFSRPRKEKVLPARPRVFYKYLDGGGRLHVSATPPPEGVYYVMLRALD
ncbi:MAG: lytic transglycosylase domain-containing protein [Vicinamibacteria bacterium]|nr:lytic transglycosylase domain-containing protein [Vicinamibacteria bacterium]